jgi:phage replication-related protein YjqB (UPF0714/DUF867 family)
MPDRYSSFLDLSKSEQVGIVYRVWVIDRSSKTAIFAPHGGHIEPGTSDVASAVAGETLSLYLFEGLLDWRPHSDLHLTSTKFDEPQAVKLAGSSRVVVAVHGRRDYEDAHTVWMGGLDHRLRDEIERDLKSAGFAAKSEGHNFAARHPNNICNRGSSKAGVQLEIPFSLRDSLRKDPDCLRAFSGAVRIAIDGAPT